VRYGVIDGLATNAAGQPLPGIIRAPGGGASASHALRSSRKTPPPDASKVSATCPSKTAAVSAFHDLTPGRYAVGLWYSGQNEGSGMQLYPDNTNPRFFSVAGGESMTALTS